MTCLWQHKNATQHDLGSKKPIFFNCLLDGAHTIFLSAQTLISLFIILVITSFFRYNIKPQLQTGNKLLTEEQTLYDKIGEIM